MLSSVLRQLVARFAPARPAPLARLALLAHQIEQDRAAAEAKLLDQSRLQVPPVRLRQLFLAVAEDPNAEWPIAGLGRIVDAETAGADGRRRRPLRQVDQRLVEFGGRKLSIER